ncbi:DUF3168 domain-containing protein [Ralstonia syzygii subsp. celebesensis]|uniref:DUF3168 domain-containing protein n=2 Tax=Ralstonia syzygii subsp. celebesensis TaxID=1310168 RepID=A0A1U9VED2_9RALS|nr:DUF3168 domain-containing protein [Ralstonia syzygii]AQW29042.1 hypothetical protein B0B51_02730 [blood disease bacterium A2-HR MARDI]QQV54416.1 DUF3168 domain-containing protein [Ralstonia syzygii subsp. celebesensis]CCA79303.1 conserved hypothetical protein [blood disease bacterium R229]
MANSAEAIVFNAVKDLVANGDGTYRCYPDVGPEGVGRPYITYQAAGGQSANYLNNTVAAQENARMQLNVWADDRTTAIALMRSVIGALAPPPINATNIGAPVSSWEPDTKLYGSRQDFSIWFTP